MLCKDMFIRSIVRLNLLLFGKQPLQHNQIGYLKSGRFNIGFDKIGNQIANQFTY
ncbi:hypothetical protein D3C85_386330 [compost metagenome]